MIKLYVTMHPLRNGIGFWVANLALYVAAQHSGHIPSTRPIGQSERRAGGTAASQRARFYAVYVA